MQDPVKSLLYSVLGGPDTLGTADLGLQSSTIQKPVNTERTEHCFGIGGPNVFLFTSSLSVRYSKSKFALYSVDWIGFPLKKQYVEDYKSWQTNNTWVFYSMHLIRSPVAAELLLLLALPWSPQPVPSGTSYPTMPYPTLRSLIIIPVVFGSCQKNHCNNGFSIVNRLPFQKMICKKNRGWFFTHCKTRGPLAGHNVFLTPKNAHPQFRWPLGHRVVSSNCEESKPDGKKIWQLAKCFVVYPPKPGCHWQIQV